MTGFHFFTFLCVVYGVFYDFFESLVWVNQVCFYDLFFSIFMDVVLKCLRFFSSSRFKT